MESPEEYLKKRATFLFERKKPIAIPNHPDVKERINYGGKEYELYIYFFQGAFQATAYHVVNNVVKVTTPAPIRLGKIVLATKQSEAA